MFAFYMFLTLHCLADYPLQGEFLANVKATNTFLLAVHCAIWAGLIWAGFRYLGFNSQYIFPYLFAGHFAIDLWKCTRQDKTKALTTYLYIDQALHAVQIWSVFKLFHVG